MSALLALMLAFSAPDRGVVPTVGEPVPFALPVPELLALDDGTPLWALVRREAPLARVLLNLEQGTLDAEEPGAARALARALRAHVENGDARRALDRIGAVRRVGLSSGRLWVEVEAPPEALAEALALGWGDLFGGRAPVSWSAARAASRAEQARARSWTPDGLLREVSLALLYPDGHPIRRAEETDGAGRSRRALARTWRDLIREARPALLAVGDLDPAQARQTIQAAWPGLSGTSRSSAPPAPPAPVERVVIADLPGSERAWLRATLAAPGVADPRLPAAELVNSVLGGGYGGRLNQRLREQLGLTYGASSTLRVWPGHGWLEIDLECAPGAAGRAIVEVRQVLAELAAQGPSDDELRAAWRSRRRAEAEGVTTLAGLTLSYGVAAAWGLPPEWRRDQLVRLGQVSVAEAAEVAAALLSGPALWVALGDRVALARALSEAEIAVDLVR